MLPSLSSATSLLAPSSLHENTAQFNIHPAGAPESALKELPTSGYVSSFLNNKRNWSAMYLLILYD